MKKSVIAILMTTVILLSLAAPLVSTVKAADPSSWYKTVNGVLSSDYYTLYPYETNADLKIGFSKYGELINSDANVGLEYGAVDPFAPPAGSGTTSQVPKRMWVQGWFLNITYYHRTLGWRNVWAMAIHSDSVVYGNDWIRVDFTDDRQSATDVEDPRDMGSLIYGTGSYTGTPAVNGGRKTNGTAVTAPIEVLYDGPREFIAVCRTTVYDHPVYKSNSTDSDIALVQIAITIRFDKVKKDVVLLKDIKSLLAWKEGEKMKIQFSNRGEVDLGTEETAFGSYAHFWTEGQAMLPSVGKDLVQEGQATEYTCAWTLVRTEQNRTDEDYEYANYTAAGSYPQTSSATFDYAQAVNPLAGYVWSAAFWPSLSDWSIDGWEQWWTSLMAYDPHYIDYRNPSEEPFIPFYIGEWDFELWHTVDNENRTQFRGVTQYAVTKQHDASDAAMTGGKNRIDSEMQYYLNQTFNPWDLEDAVHKDIRAFKKLDINPFIFLLNDTSVSATPPHNIVSMNDAKQQSWTDPLGMQWVFRVDDINLAATFADDFDYAANYTVEFTRELNGWETNFVVRGVSYPASNTYEGSWDFQNLAPLSNAYVSVAIPLIDIHWGVTNPTLQDLIVSQLGFTAVLTVNVTYVTIGAGPNKNYTLLTATLDANPASQYAGMLYMYTENQMGRYEWINIGRDSQSVDSAGSALVAEAFGSLKKIPIGIAGMDMASVNSANQMPNVMSKFGAGALAGDYKDGNLRAALRANWCTYWPVASSNMIGVGGPIANLFSYYANDWTDAFYGIWDFAGTAYSGKVVPITCWNRNWPGYTYNTYESSDTVGYAVIATHKDINGTVLFTVWGNWGRDTYYASLWLHGDEARGLAPGIIQLQSAPKGLTSIILEINYANPYHPWCRIVECLGTISETLWHHQPSQPFWEGEACSDGSLVTTPTLEVGKLYRIEVSEIFWYNYAANLAADAMYYTTNAADHWQWINHFAAPDGHSFLQINGADVNWGHFSNGNTGHAYSITYIGQGAPITFRVVDWIDQNYANNNCHFPIKIYVSEYKGGIHDP